MDESRVVLLPAGYRALSRVLGGELCYRTAVITPRRVRVEVRMHRQSASLVQVECAPRYARDKVLTALERCGLQALRAARRAVNARRIEILVAHLHGASLDARAMEFDRAEARFVALSMALGSLP